MTIALPPYADLLGIVVHETSEDGIILAMPFGDAVIGRPGFLHGGAIAGLMEMALAVTLHSALGDEAALLPIKPINMTINFMRGGREVTTYASAQIDRLGTRVVNVEAHAWQTDRHAPLATASCNFLRGEAKAETINSDTISG